MNSIQGILGGIGLFFASLFGVLTGSNTPPIAVTPAPAQQTTSAAASHTQISQAASGAATSTVSNGTRFTSKEPNTTQSSPLSAAISATINAQLAPTVFTTASGTPTLRYPMGWQARTAYEFSDSVKVYFTPPAGQKYGYISFSKGENEDNNLNFSGLTLVLKAPVAISGTTGYITEIKDSSLSIRQVSLHLNKNELNYTIDATIPEADWAAQGDLILASLSTIRISDTVPTPAPTPAPASPASTVSSKAPNNRQLVKEVTFESYAGSPLFASIILPTLIDSQKDYPVYTWNGSSYVLYKNIPPGQILSFPSGGISKFKIGIDSGLKLCGGHTFLKQISFVTSGTFKGNEQYVTTGVDDPYCVAQSTTPQ